MDLKKSIDHLTISLEETPLCSIMNHFNSDKGKPVKHNYTQVYHQLFNEIRDQKINLFELGIGTINPNIPSSMGPHGTPGASLKGWEAYFPAAQIRGADVDRDILFSTSRIKTYYCNSLDNTSIQKLWEECDLDYFDIMIDDGFHAIQSNLNFFLYSLSHLKVGGIYVIEGIKGQDLEAVREPLSRMKNLQVYALRLPFQFYSPDNNLVIVQRVFTNPDFELNDRSDSKLSTEVKIPYKMTYISGYIPLDKHEERLPGKTTEFYFNHAEEMVKSGAPFIIYLDDQIEDCLIERFSAYPNVIIKLFSLKDSIFMSQKDKKLTLPKRLIKGKDTALYLLTQFTKFEWLSLALQENPFKTDYFSWIDFGGFQYLDKSIFPRMYLQMKMIAQHPLTQKMRIPKSWDIACIIPTDYMYWWWLGNFLVAHKDVLKLICELFFKEAQNHIDKDTLTWELNVLAEIAQKHPDCFETYPYESYLTHLFNYYIFK